MSVPPYPPPDPASPPQGSGAYPPPGQPAWYPPPDGAGYPSPGQPGAQLPPPGGASYPPPGQPGAQLPPPSGPPVGYPAGMIPPPGVKKNRKKQLLIAGVAVVVLLAVGIFAFVQNRKTSTTAADVGACIKITSATLTDPKTEQAPCTDPAALFVVTETGDGNVKCDENEQSYVEGRDTDDPDSRVCLRFNLKVGECLDPGSTAVSVPKKVDCSSATTETAKLVALKLDTSAESQCPSLSTPLALTKRNILYCFGDPAS